MTEQEKLEYAIVKNNAFADYCHLKIEKVQPDLCVGTVELTPELKNPYDMAHGGLLMTLADCCAAVASRTDGRRYITLDSNMHFLKNTQEGCLTATATIVNRGGTICVSHVEIRDDTNRLLCDGTITMFCVKDKNSQKSRFSIT